MQGNFSKQLALQLVARQDTGGKGGDADGQVPHSRHLLGVQHPWRARVNGEITVPATPHKTEPDAVPRDFTVSGLRVMQPEGTAKRTGEKGWGAGRGLRLRAGSVRGKETLEKRVTRRATML